MASRKRPARDPRGEPRPSRSRAGIGVAGVLLAGGMSRRMGGREKPFLPLAGKTLLARVVARVRPQVADLLLNANGDPARFAGFGFPVREDAVPGYAGPLAGVLTGLEWAAAIPGRVWLASFATDAPFLPLDLVARLLAAAEGEGAEIATARSNGRAHPVFGLWRVALAAELRRAVVEEGVRKIDVFTARYRVAYADFAALPVDPFFNVNRPADLKAAEALLAPV